MAQHIPLRYARVNKKALDQYVSFSEQRDALIGRKGDQDSADTSIVELIRVLDGQKDEAIERTFKQVSMYVTHNCRDNSAHPPRPHPLLFLFLFLFLLLLLLLLLFCFMGQLEGHQWWDEATHQ